MRIVVPKESAPGERRVALVPEVVRRLGAFSVSVERGAGGAAGFPDADYEAAGAQLAAREGLYADAGAVLRVARPSPDEVAELAPGTIVIGFLAPLTDLEGIKRLEERGVVAFAMESIPRTTRAQ